MFRRVARLDGISRGGVGHDGDIQLCFDAIHEHVCLDGTNIESSDATVVNDIYLSPF